MKMRFVKDFEYRDPNFNRSKDSIIYVEGIKSAFIKINLQKGLNRWLPIHLFNYDSNDINFVYFKEEYPYVHIHSRYINGVPISTEEKKEILGRKEPCYQVKDGNDWIPIPLEYLEFVPEEKNE